MAVDKGARCLVLNGATLGATGSGVLALFSGGHPLSSAALEGLSATAGMASLCRVLLEQAGWEDGPGRIVAVTGPGSFTGLRATLALAQGLALGYSASLCGVTLGQAYRAREGWSEAYCITRARRDRLFMERPDGTVWAGPPGAIALPARAFVVGNGVSMLDLPQHETLIRADCTSPDPRDIYRAACHADDRPSLQPLYIDAPEARLPSQGLRPSPV